MVFLLLLLSFPVSAQSELFLMNKPFKGLTDGSGESLKVELEPLLAALGLPGRQVNGGWLIGSAEHEGLCRSGVVVVEGQVVLLEGPLVPLQQILEPLPYRMVVNDELGIVDVYPHDKSPGSSVASGSLTGPSKVVMQYYEALHHFPELRSWDDFRDEASFVGGLDRMMNAMRPLVTDSFRADLDLRYEELMKKLGPSFRVFRSISRERMDRELARYPREKAIMERLMAWISTLSWTRAEIQEEEIDGQTATVLVNLPIRHPLSGRVTDQKVTVRLLEARGEWKIDSIGGARGAGVLPSP